MKSQSVEPVLESSLTGHHVVRVSTGSFHCGAVTEEGTVHMWGENSYGQCGISGFSVVPNPTPINIVDDEIVPPELVRIQDVACGAEHTLALSRKHEVWAWGSGCQLGLVTTVFPVWKAEKVEHLSGRYVVQIACGEFHSLALVRSHPLPESSQQLEDKCGQCKQPLYTFIDKDDHVIISDNHYCPLGVELSDAKEGQTSKQTSPALMAKMETSVHDPQSSVVLPGDFCPSENAQNESHSDDTAGDKDVDHSDPAPDTTTDRSQSQQQCHLRTKSSLYPDEQALKDYLRRIAEQSQSEQIEAGFMKGSSPPSRQTSLKDSYRLVQDNKPTFPSLAPPAMNNNIQSNLSDDIALTPLKDSVIDSVSHDLSEDMVISSDPLACEEVSDESFSTDRNNCPHESLEAKKSASLTDIRIDCPDGNSRRRSLPGLLSPGILRFFFNLLNEPCMVSTWFRTTL